MLFFKKSVQQTGVFRYKKAMSKAMSEELDTLRAALSTPIVLIGMMGSGKTHMGRLIAKKLGWPFYDSDQLIEEKAGCKVADIFDIWGEEKFREVEARTIQGLIDMKRSVIATGGGAILNKATADKIFARSYSVWVRADMDKIYQRVSKNKNRPLLACENPQDVLNRLMRQRQPIYEQASFTLHSGRGDEHEAVMQLLREIYTVSRKDEG